MNLRFIAVTATRLPLQRTTTLGETILKYKTDTSQIRNNLGWGIITNNAFIVYARTPHTTMEMGFCIKSK